MATHRFRTDLRGIRLDGVNEVTLGPFVLRPLESQISTGPMDIDEGPEELEGLSPEKYSQLFQRYVESLMYRVMSAAKCSIEFVSDNDSASDAEREIDQAIDILRLGDLCGLTRRLPRVLPQVTHLAPDSEGYCESTTVAGGWLPTLVITQDKVSMLESRFSHAYPFDLGPLTGAMDRFRSAHDRENDVDAFIDLLVCLETIFSDGDPVDTRYKLAMRAAHFLSSNLPELKKRDIFSTISSAYKHRSSVLHGREASRDWARGNFPLVWNIARWALWLEVKMARTLQKVVVGRLIDDFYILHDPGSGASAAGDIS